MAQAFEIAVEVQLAAGVGLLQSFQEQTAEQAAEHFHGQKESGTAGFPGSLRRQSAAGYHTVQMRMQQKVLSPGVQHGEEADDRTQVLGVSGDGEQGLRHGAEQDGVDGL